MAEWIACRERLPPSNVEVLAAEFVRFYDSVDMVLHIALWDTAGVYGDDYSWRDREAIRLDGVTHWMPLPAPPGLPDSAATNKPVSLTREK